MRDANGQSADEGRPRFLEALFWAVALSALFMVVYGGCNWITSQRSHVRTFYFAWERSIPLIPLFIIPYMSIDLFFFGSFFVCSRRDEIYLLSKRIATAICIAGICFLVFPLKLGFPRSEVAGWLGAIFRFLRGFDQPYNLAPSLHIALRSILWFVYVAHTAGWLRRTVRAWFVLIGLSTLFTWQHQVFDVLTGQLLALFCFYLYPVAADDSTHSMHLQRGTQNQRLSIIYLSLAAACFLVAVLVGSWAWLMLWPTFSLAVIAIGYRIGSPDVFRKRAGQIPFSAWVMLAPYLIGSWISYLYHRQHAPPFVEAAPGIYLGRHLNGREATALRERGIVAVLDMTSEFSRCRQLRGLAYLNVPLLDLTTPTLRHLELCVPFLKEHAARGPVYVHCALGYSRSACVVAAYLMTTGKADTPEQAIDLLRQSRPQLVLRRDTLSTLKQYQEAVGQTFLSAKS